MQPPFQLTAQILSFVSEISHLLGKYEGLHMPIPQLKLRRQNKIKTIQGSLAIEGNTLDLEQTTAILENKRVLGPKKDILEVQNAIQLYDSLHDFKPAELKDLLRAHLILMKGLAQDAGQFRKGSVGILKGSKVAHVAPPAKQISRLMGDLFQFLLQEKDTHPLVKSCVFHYELEFIHPFLDGNGRIGRFWQHLILTNYHAAFEYIPIESLIHERQAFYYRALEQSDKRGDSTVFIEFSLEIIKDSLKDFLDHLQPLPETPESRLNLAKNKFKQNEFTRKEYILFFITISTATASRDLALGVSMKLLLKNGAKATTKYRFSDF